jgi:hypothetical protein
VLKPSWLRHNLALLVSTKVSEEHAVSIFSAEMYRVRMWLWAQCQLPNRSKFRNLLTRIIPRKTKLVYEYITGIIHKGSVLTTNKS